MATSLRGVVFDLDDTLSDYSAVEAHIWAATADALALALPAVDLEAARARFVALREPLFARSLAGGWSVERYRREQLTQTVAPWGAVSEPLLAEHCALRDASVARVVPVEGTHALLDALRGAGLRVGVLTNGSHGLLERKLAALGIEEHLHAVISAADAGTPKPEPAAYAAAAEALGLPSASLAMVGDHVEWDVAAPLRAGYARAVWLDRGHGVHDPSGLPPAAITVTALAQVPAALGL